ncbi:MAG TPA: ABC transporter permease [Vicinamibacterales bacterium]|nr:ABC transporter permease [Vicinamibacterales bacterium]
MLLQDLRYAFRTLRRSAALSIVIVASLALGIGANSAIFSVVNALLLKPLPYPEPDRLAVLWLRSPGINIPQDWPSPGQYFDVVAENKSFAETSISQGRVGTLLGVSGGAQTPAGQEAQRVEALMTSSSLFTMLGAKPFRGRLLRADEDKPGQPAVVILSHGCWQRLFGSDPDIVGKTVTLNVGVAGTGETKNQFEVVGILGPEFLLNEEIMPTVSSIKQMDMFLPMPWGADAVQRRGDENYNLMARLKPGVTMAQAKEDVAAIAGRIRDKDKRDKTFTIDVVPLVESVVGNVRLAMLVLLGSVALVLLIACANVANLLLTRATGRQKEVAVRTALGASWSRLVRQLLTESLLLGVLGGAAGLVVAAAALQVVKSINPGNIPRLNDISLDGTVLLFTFVVSIVTGLLFGLAPALRAARVDLNTSMKAGGRNTAGEGGFGSSRRRLRSLLVVAEIAISLMLLVGAGLLIRSFVRLQNVSPGFEEQGVVSMRVSGAVRQFANRDESLAFYRPFGEALARVPGVVSRGAVSSLPFTSSVGWGSISVEGWTPQPGQELQVDQRGATTEYFQTMRVPLVMGRYFTDADLAQNAEPVVLIDKKFADRFWPDGSAVGKHLWNDPKRQMTIVGVVGTVKQYGLDVDGRLAFYRPSVNAGWHVARVTGDPAVVARDMIRKIREMDRTITVVDVQTMAGRMSQSMARQRFATLMLGAFAAFALVLAVVGVYGVMSHLVTQGGHDIGVRMALGAERSSILKMVLRQGLELTAAGVVIGLAGAVVLTRVMASLLFEVGARDVATFVTVPLVLLVTATLAIYIPALRATRVDPVVALRDE